MVFWKWFLIGKCFKELHVHFNNNFRVLAIYIIIFFKIDKTSEINSTFYLSSLPLPYPTTPTKCFAMFVFCWQSFAKLESTTSWGWQHWHLLLALKDKPQTRSAVLWTGTNPDMARHGMLPPWARYVVSSTNNAHASFGRVGVLALGVWEWEGSIIINGFHGNCFATSFFCKYEPDKYTDAHRQIRTKKKTLSRSWLSFGDTTTSPFPFSFCLGTASRSTTPFAPPPESIVMVRGRVYVHEALDKKGPFRT